MIPILYLRGLSTEDFRPALESLLGEDAAGFHASGNVIDCLPKRLHSRAKGLLSEII